MGSGAEALGTGHWPEAIRRHVMLAANDRVKKRPLSGGLVLLGWVFYSASYLNF